ncbi:exodeoxyribonuclease V subunit alpha [Halomonas halocynthiae]|uniref:exodeoxyribonuclease V subunit alpha n=1 Tax=Halomonas halocynthiae TaxID=176290 RepID=UPI00040BBB49|nr:exodeoxyribonuclease V subunit alpha [Halomonas halocynthiae]
MTPLPNSLPPVHNDTTAARHTPEALFELLNQWVARGWLRALDRAFAAFLLREVNDTHPLLLLAAALASHQLGRGHVCLDLSQTLLAPDLALSLPPDGDTPNDPPPLPSQVMAGLTLAKWQAALAHPTLVSNGPGNTPLVLAGEHQRPRLYLRRYWHYEQQIHQQLDTRLNTPDDGLEASTSPDRLRPLLDTLFTHPAQLPGEIDWQKAACALASRSRFAVITGGPGTGKTTTVVRLLALLQARQLGLGLPALRIRLAAPTGKAAARLNESIAGQVDRLPLDGLARHIGQHPQADQDATVTSITTQLKHAIPTNVSTLHRLLGARPGTRRLHYHRHRPLPLDVLVVDEASMIDVSLMAAMLDALPPHARLILLGDKDQLASVEAGSVLGDLCARAEAGHYTPATAEWLSTASGQSLPSNMCDDTGQPLDQAISMLRLSHRFTADSGIGQLAEAVNAGNLIALDHIWATGYADLSHLRIKSDNRSRLAELTISGYPEGFPRQAAHPAASQALPPVGYRHYLEVMHSQRPAQNAASERFDDWASDVLAAHGRFQLLCALRRGPWGVEGLNDSVRTALEKEQLISTANGLHQWYAGRPVLVTGNDYGLGLMNGDIGITLSTPHPEDTTQQALRVAFPASDGTGHIKWVLPSRLKSVDTVFAMTVHKSQGSEFDHTALVLPDAPSPILTRELVYTGITRARHWLTLVEPGRGQLSDAVKRRVMRVSGLSISP